MFPSDLAKSIQAPALLVNADDTEACLRAADLALRFRYHFGSDIFIDLIGYRRHGHNEGDEPSFTQPTLYAKIKKHPPVLEKYRQQLLQEKVLSSEAGENIKKNYENQLEKVWEEAKRSPKNNKTDFTGIKPYEKNIPLLQKTKTTTENLQIVLEALVREPDHFNLHPKNQKTSAKATPPHQTKSTGLESLRTGLLWNSHKRRLLHSASQDRIPKEELFPTDRPYILISKIIRNSLR